MSKNWIVPSLIAGGVLLIVISLISPKSNSDKPLDKALATVSDLSGQATYKNEQIPTEVDLKKDSPLHRLDTIRTFDNSDIGLEWVTGGAIRVLENSEVVLDLLDENQPVVILKSGELFVEKFGSKINFWIRKEGQLLSAVDFVALDKKYQSKVKEPIPSESQKLKEDLINQSDIEKTLNSKRNDFFKCYGQVLQKSPQSRGQVLIGFQIQNNGQTQKIEVNQSDIEEASFKSCLVEVVARTTFKSFSGAPVSTVFPLKFE